MSVISRKNYTCWSWSFSETIPPPMTPKYPNGDPSNSLASVSAQAPRGLTAQDRLTALTEKTVLRKLRSNSFQGDAAVPPSLFFLGTRMKLKAERVQRFVVHYVFSDLSKIVCKPH